MSTKRYFLTILILIAVIIGGFAMLARTPLLIRSVGIVGRSLYGYDMKADEFFFDPSGAVYTRGFTVTDARKGNFVFTSSALSVEKTRRNSFQTEIEKITMKDPKIRIRLGGGKKETEADLSFIQRIPAVRLLSMTNGEFTLLLKGSDFRVIIRNIDLTVKEFSPKTGGTLNFSGLIEVNRPDTSGVFASGKCKGQFKLTGILPDIIGRGLIEITVDKAQAATIGLESARLAIPVVFEKDRIIISRSSAGIDIMSFNQGEKKAQLKNGKLTMNARYHWATGALYTDPVEIVVPGIGTIKGTARMTLKGSMPIAASLETGSVNFSNLFGIAGLFMTQEESRKWTIQGSGSLKGRMEGTLAGKTPVITGNAVMDIKKGGFASPDGSKAAQGVDGSIVVNFSFPAGDKDASMKVSSRISSGEYLWGKYYKDLSKEQSRFVSESDIKLNSRTASRIKGTCDIFNTGRYAYDGFFAPGQWEFHVNAQDLPLKRINTVFAREYLSQTSASLKDIEADGRITADILVASNAGKLSTRGNIKVAAASLQAPAMALDIKAIDIDIPFDLVRAEGANADPSLTHKAAPLGMITVSGFTKGNYNLPGITIPLIASGSDIAATGIISLPFYSGSFRIRDLAVKDILGKSPQVSFAASVTGIDFPRLLDDLTGFTFPGTVKARFPMIAFQDGELKTEGSLAIDIFDGRIEVLDMYVKDLFASSRKIGGDIVFNDIDLGKITDTIKVGKITGVIKGSLKDLVIEYGQPSRFVFDLDTVKKSGVSRKVSVDAIENISILGTGTGGIGAILKSGVNKFFKEYPYSRIGVRCTLENDNFNIRGKIVEGQKEYLIRRAFLRGIDVVNRDPQNMVSFKDMQERVSRVFHKEKDGTGPTIKVN
ncbi:MAG: translocation/assembly module TamB domain-containing protein [Syntrophorhabdaceae bacterium]